MNSSVSFLLSMGKHKIKRDYIPEKRQNTKAYRRIAVYFSLLLQFLDRIMYNHSWVVFQYFVQTDKGEGFLTKGGRITGRTYQSGQF